jgi:aspartate kinase
MSPPLSVDRQEMGRSLLRNNSALGWVVQKFGGTSVGKFPDKIAEDIVRCGPALLSTQQEVNKTHVPVG